MKEIGKFLKEHREKLGLSIGDISDITKMNINIIRNIEEGNVAYFNNDLTYLRYYVKSYSNAVNVDFDSIESELDRSTLSYTQSMQTLEVEKMVELNENIKVKRTQMKRPHNRGIKQVSKSVDWTLVSLISIVTIILGFLIYSVTVNLLDKTPADTVPPIVDETPADGDKDPEEEKPAEEEPIVAKVKVEKEDANTYVISNWKAQKDFSIKTLYGANTWTQIKVNNQVVTIPNEESVDKIFTPGEELVITEKYKLGQEELELKAGDVISIRYGIMLGNKFVINDEDYKLDESIANYNGATSIVFKLDQDVE